MYFFFQAEDGIRDLTVTGVQTCALPILRKTRDQSAGAGNALVGVQKTVEVMALRPEVAGLNHPVRPELPLNVDRKSTRLNSSHSQISYAVFCLKKKKRPALRLRFGYQ